jgi:hypothetical protein
MQVRWLDVLRDALAIVVGSALVRVAAISADLSEVATGALVLALFAAGFCAAGCLSPRRRFTHLGFVAFATWLILALYGVITGSASAPAAYILLLINPTLVGMFIGGVASLAIVRPPAEPPG